MVILNRRSQWFGVLALALVLSACATYKRGSKGYTEGLYSNKNGSAGATTLAARKHGQVAAGQVAVDAKGVPMQHVLYFPYDSNVVKIDALQPQKTGKPHLVQPKVSSRKVLDTYANYLVSHPHAIVRLEGNTDERGSREYNIALGERRANSVADILEMDGALTKQVRVVSYGKEKPVALGHNENAYAQNRRVNITVE